MISLFYGEKGSGKTKRMVEHANAFVQTPCENKYSNGHAVFIDIDYRRMYELNRDIKLISLDDYGVFEPCDIIVFMKGLVAGNSDIRRIYIDSIEKIAKKPSEELEEFFAEAHSLAERYTVDIFIVIDRKLEELPVFLQSYAV